MRLSEMPAAALLVVFAIVTVIVGSMIMGEMKVSISDGKEYNATSGGETNVYLSNVNTSLNEGDTALGNITDWLDIITLVVAAAVIIGVLGLMRLGGGGL